MQMKPQLSPVSGVATFSSYFSFAINQGVSVYKKGLIINIEILLR